MENESELKFAEISDTVSTAKWNNISGCNHVKKVKVTTSFNHEQVITYLFEQKFEICPMWIRFVTSMKRPMRRLEEG